MVHTKDNASEDSDDEDESTLDKSRVMINSNHFLDITDQQKAYLQWHWLSVNLVEQL